MVTGTKTMKNDDILDDALSQTDLGEAIRKNKNLVYTILGVAIFFIVSFLGYYFHKQNQMQSFDKLYTGFQSQNYEAFEKGSLSAADFVKATNTAFADFEGSAFTGPVYAEVGKKLFDKKQPNEVIALLDGKVSSFKNDNILFYILSYQLSSSYEDVGNNEKALATLETLLSTKVLDEKLYFDLGRLSKKTNQVEKANRNFQYVIDNFPNSEFAKLSKVMMND